MENPAAADRYTTSTHPIKGLGAEPLCPQRFPWAVLRIKPLEICLSRKVTPFKSGPIVIKTVQPRIPALPSDMTMAGMADASLVPGLPSGGLVALGILFLIYLLVEAFFLWVAGELVVGRRVTYGEALGIAFFGTILVVATLVFLSPFGLLISFGLAMLLFLLVVKRFFHTGWFRAIGVSIVTIIVAIIIFVVLAAVLGISLSLVGL
ncbi:MAG TPA: hypothetical protein VE177_08225 [Candidatus Binatus sp.]|nr:hypothetical protein [Candidatus Binatus sp.]